MFNIAKLARALVVPLAILVSVPAFADTAPTRVVFVNGIMNTPLQASNTADRLSTILVQSQYHTNSGQPVRPFAVSSIWNPKGWYNVNGNSNCDTELYNWVPVIGQAWSSTACMFQDQAELFMLKTAEELFGTSMSNVVNANKANTRPSQSDSNAVAAYADNLFVMKSLNDGHTYGSVLGDNDVEGYNKIPPNGLDDTKAVVNSLATTMGWGPSGDTSPVIIVAHSQGNLLANLAYSLALRDNPNALYKHARIVNIANTSEFSIDNLSLMNTADGMVSPNAGSGAVGDAGLRMVAFNHAWARKTTYCDNTANCYCRLMPAETVSKATTDVNGYWPDGTLIPDSVIAHGMLETYLSERQAKAFVQMGSIPKDATAKFRDFAEALVYAAAESMDAANVPPPPPPPPAPAQQNYITTDFSNGVPNMYTWGSPYPLYDANSQSYMVSGTGGFGIGLPPDLSVIEITARVMFIATDNQPNQFSLGLWSNNPGVSDAVYIDFLHNVAICNTNGYGTLSMSGDPSPWQCRDNLGIDTNQLINYGWIEIYARYDRTYCQLTVSARRLDMSLPPYGSGKTIPLVGTQCTNARGAFAFTPGSPSNTALMLFNYLQVNTTK